MTPATTLTGEELSRQMYLTVPEAVEYLRFCSRKAFYEWVHRQKDVRRFGTHKRAIYMRKDLDVAVRRRTVTR